MSRPISITIRVPVETCKTGGGVSASCRFLNVACFGESTGDALNDLSGVLTRHLGACLEFGRFDQLLRGSGYSALARDAGAAQGRFLDIALKLGVANQAHAAQEARPEASSMLSTWMT